MSQGYKQRLITIIPIGIAINLIVGTITNALKLPVYLDAIGTIISTLMGGVWAGAITGVSSFLIGGVITNPVLPWFSLTQVAIAVFVGFVASKAFLRTWPKIIISGVALGIVAGIVSAPVIVYLFGGITGSGASLIVAFLLSTGDSILKSVFLSGLAAEPLDKTLQLVFAVMILRGMPKTVLNRFNSNLLFLNEFVNEKSTEK